MEKIIGTDYLQELGVEPHKYIFAMGRFVPEKHFHHLIRSFASLGQTEYKLVVAGDTDFEDEYSRKLKKLVVRNEVILTGFIKGRKLHQLLTHVRSFVLPSSHEGVPIALLEAMSPVKYSIWKDHINLIGELNDFKYISGGIYFKIHLK